MHSIRLDIKDSVFDKVIYFLSNLPVNEVKIIEDTENVQKIKPKKFSAVSLDTKGFSFNREEANAR